MREASQAALPGIAALPTKKAAGDAGGPFIHD